MELTNFYTNGYGLPLKRDDDGSGFSFEAILPLTFLSIHRVEFVCWLINVSKTNWFC